MYKFVNSFGVSAKKNVPLHVENIVKAASRSLAHQNQDVRDAAVKIILDAHRLSGCVDEKSLHSDLSDKAES